MTDGLVPLPARTPWAAHADDAGEDEADLEAYLGEVPHVGNRPEDEIAAQRTRRLVRGGAGARSMAHPGHRPGRTGAGLGRSILAASYMWRRQRRNCA